jgi:hypothetical protein
MADVTLQIPPAIIYIDPDADIEPDVFSTGKTTIERVAKLDHGNPGSLEVRNRDPGGVDVHINGVAQKDIQVDVGNTRVVRYTQVVDHVTGREVEAVMTPQLVFADGHFDPMRRTTLVRRFIDPSDSPGGYSSGDNVNLTEQTLTPFPATGVTHVAVTDHPIYTYAFAFGKASIGINTSGLSNDWLGNMEMGNNGDFMVVVKMTDQADGGSAGDRHIITSESASVRYWSLSVNYTTRELYITYGHGNSTEYASPYPQGTGIFLEWDVWHTIHVRAVNSSNAADMHQWAVGFDGAYTPIDAVDDVVSNVFNAEFTRLGGSDLTTDSGFPGQIAMFVVDCIPNSITPDEARAQFVGDPIISQTFTYEEKPNGMWLVGPDTLYTAADVSYISTHSWGGYHDEVLVQTSDRPTAGHWTTSFNGTAHTAEAIPPFSLYDLASVANNRAALVYLWGGYDASTYYDDGYHYDGLAWSTESAQMGINRAKHGAGGSPTDCMVLSGETTGFSQTNTTESYNGTAWSSETAFPVASLENVGYAGSTLDGSCVGSSFDTIDTSYRLYNGTTWTTDATVVDGYIIQTGYIGEFADAGLRAGGRLNGSTSDNIWSSSYFYNGTAEVTIAALKHIQYNISISEPAYSGTHRDQVFSGGDYTGTGYRGACENIFMHFYEANIYDYSSWTT